MPQFGQQELQVQQNKQAQELQLGALGLSLKVAHILAMPCRYQNALLALVLQL